MLIRNRFGQQLTV